MSTPATECAARSKSTPKFDTSRRRVDSSDRSMTLGVDMSKKDNIFDTFCQPVDKLDKCLANRLADFRR